MNPAFQYNASDIPMFQVYCECMEEAFYQISIIYSFQKLRKIFVESVRLNILLFNLLTTVALRSMKVKTNLDLLFCLSPTFQKSNADPVSTDVCKSSIESFFTKSFQYVLQTIPTNILIFVNITGLRIYLDVNYST